MRVGKPTGADTVDTVVTVDVDDRVGNAGVVVGVVVIVVVDVVVASVAVGEDLVFGSNTTVLVATSPGSILGDATGRW